MPETRSNGSFSRRWLILPISLIVLSIVLFVTGVVIERGEVAASAIGNSYQGGVRAPTTSQDPDGGHEGSLSPHSQGISARQDPGSLANEKVLGLDLENPWLVGAFVVVWLGLLAALICLGRIAWLALLLAAIAAAILDIGEIVRKAEEAKTLVAILAVLVMLAHVALAALALIILSRSFRWKAIPSRSVT